MFEQRKNVEQSFGSPEIISETSVELALAEYQKYFNAKQTKSPFRSRLEPIQDQLNMLAGGNYFEIITTKNDDPKDARLSYALVVLNSAFKN